LSREITADLLLSNYLDGFLWPDEDWLERDGATATYWQARLAQTTTVEVLPDGKTKWQVRTRVVENVPSGEVASLMCVALNRYAIGWSLAYNAQELTVEAIASISAPPEWDTFFLRLSEKAKLSAWMSDVISERLAEALGGSPAFSHPRAQPGIRQTYDGTYHYLETLRGRPEWILDLTPYRFPPVEDIAATFAEMVGAPEEAVWCDDNVLGIRVGVLSGRSAALQAGFGKHPIAGTAWESSLQLPCSQMSGPLAHHLMATTWKLFDDPDTNLLGGWTHEAGRLIFQQWNTMSEARNQEQMGSYTGHSATDLWGFTSSLSDVLGAISQGDLLPDSEGGEIVGEVDERVTKVVAAIAEQARPAVSERYEEGEERADRRLLWLEHRQTLVVAVWFNPIGPTVTSTELRALPDGSQYLVHYRRHPLAPFYRVLGEVKDERDMTQLQPEADNLLIGDESLPNVLLLWEEPNATAVDVPDALRERVIEIADGSDRDLIGRSAWIAQTMGSPWEFAAVDQTEAKQVQAAASDTARAKSEPDRGFATWWQLVSSFENVTANFRQLPDAWDGALNTQKVCGNLTHFDAGPLLVTYSNIGMPGPESDPKTS